MGGNLKIFGVDFHKIPHTIGLLMKHFNKSSIIFVGDIHGVFNTLMDVCSNATDSLIIQVGDFGLGFQRKEYELKNILTLDKACQGNNNCLVAIRGNHDSKTRFDWFRQQEQPTNTYFPEDYEVCMWNGKKIQFIGGAISIDRTARIPGVSYWEDEGVVWDKYKPQKVDILVTHTAPSWCFPQTFNEMVYGWAGEDAYLIEDLNEERAVVDEIFKICKPSLHVYGHFHSYWSEEIQGCKHRLLDINEVWEYVT